LSVSKLDSSTPLATAADNLHILTGSGAENQDAFSGGNVAVFITDAGVTLVDSKLPGFGPTILERIKTVTNEPITRIINTHTHGDHTGSNSFFGASIESIVHENARASMAKMPEFSAANAQFLPKRTYKDKLTVGAGKDQIDLNHFGRGHTNGDTFVVFTALRTMHVGDMFAWKALPFVGHGGCVVEQPDTLAKAAAVPNVDTIFRSLGERPPSSSFVLNCLRRFPCARPGGRPRSQSQTGLWRCRLSIPIQWRTSWSWSTILLLTREHR